MKISQHSSFAFKAFSLSLNTSSLLTPLSDESIDDFVCMKAESSAPGPLVFWTRESFIEVKWERCPTHCRMLSSIPGFYCMDGNA